MIRRSMSILEMSIAGAVMILVIIILRAIVINKLPKKTLIVLWGVALIRLLIPYSIPSALSVYSLIGKLAKPRGSVSMQAVDVIYMQETPAMEFVKDTTTAMVTTASKYPVDPWKVIWLTGVVILAVFFLVSYVRFRGEFLESLPVENKTVSDWLDKHTIRRGISVRYSDRISAPLTFGVRHPIILLPKTLVWPDNVCAKCVQFSDMDFINDKKRNTIISVSDIDFINDKKRNTIISVSDIDFINDKKRNTIISVSDIDFIIDKEQNKSISVSDIEFIHDKKRSTITSANDIDFILEHEYIHIIRFDAVTKLVLTAALCIHWFNPFVWAMYILANRDIELSCDEAVVGRFGENSKSVYANILIRMEEKKSGLTPLCNNFSKNAIEERIVAIMKIKKYTLPAVTAAVVLVASVLTVFATSAADISVGAEGDDAVTDKQETFRKHLEKRTEIDFMGEDNIESAHAEITYNESTDSYSIELSLISKETVSEEQVDRYYDILSKTYDRARVFVNGTDYGDVIQAVQPTAGEAVSEDDGTRYVGKIRPTDGLSDAMLAIDAGSGDLEKSYSSEDLAEYALWGLFIKDGSFYYKDQKVRNFADEYNVAGGVATRNMYRNDEGSVDVHTVRQPTRNADGSINPEGEIIGLEIEEYALADSPDDYVVAYGEAVTNQVAADAEEKAFGGEAVQTSEAITVQNAADAGKKAFGGEAVQTSEAITVQNAADAGEKAFGSEAVQTSKADTFQGAADAGEIAFGEAKVQTSEAYAVQSADTGEDFMELFSAKGKYGKLGISFEKNEVYGNVYYNGMLVNVLIDRSPDGGYFSVRSTDKGGVNLKTVYDADGTLTGVEIVDNEHGW